MPAKPLRSRRKSHHHSRDNRLIRSFRLEPLENRLVLSCTSADATSVLGWPDSVAGEIAEVGDSECFYFPAIARDRFVWETVAGSLSDTVMRLFDQDGVIELAFDDNGGPGSSSRIEWTAPASDQFYYFIEVRASGTDEVGTFSLTTIDDHGNTAETATALTTSAIMASIEHKGDRDFFSFDAVAGRHYTITDLEIPTSELVVAYEVLYDTDGESVLAESISTESPIQWIAPSNGTYFVSVSEGRGGVDYLLRIEEVEYTDDHGNKPSTATNIDLPYLSESTIEVGQDVDYFSFAAREGETFLIESDPGSVVGSAIRLFDADGVTELAADADERRPSITWTAQSDGVYFVEVQDSSINRVGTYTLDVSVVPVDDHGNVASLASPLPTSAFVGTIDYDGDADFFSFEATANVVYNIAAEPPGRATRVVSVYDIDGITELAGISARTSSRRLTWSPSVNGTYFIKVFASSDPGSYTLDVDELAIVDDHGNSFSSATAIIPGTPYESAIDYNGDVDFFSFAAVEGETYVIGVDVPKIPHLPLRLYDANGVSAVPFPYNFTSTTWTSPETATYFVSAADYGNFRVGSYTLRVTGDDHGNNAESATRISHDDPPLSAQIAHRLDEDFFSFSATEGETYVLQASTPGFRSVLRLFDTDGATELVHDESSQGDSRFVWTAPAEGDYFAVVSYSRYLDEWDYTLDVSVYVDDHGNDSTTATPIMPLKSVVAGYVDYGSDHDFFSFTAIAETSHVLTVNKGRFGNSELQLIDTDGTTLIDAARSTESLVSLRYTPSVTGTYFIAVLGTAVDGSDAYTLSVDTESDLPDALPIDSEFDSGLAAIVAAMDFSEDVDLFSFDAVAGEVYAAEVDTDVVHFSGRLRLRDAEGYVATRYHDESFFVWTAPSTGTYFIEVRDWPFSSGSFLGNYTLNMRRTDSAGNNSASALAIDLPAAPIAGAIDHVDDVDFYSFAATEGAVYIAELESEWMQRWPDDDIQLYDTDGLTELAGDDDTRLGRLTWTATATDTFYMRIRSRQRSLSARDYVFSLRESVDDHGGDVQSATALPSHEILASIDYAGDVDFFSFDAIAGQRYRVASMEHGATLYDVDGATPLAGGRTFLWSAPLTGTYFIAVESSSAMSYALDVDSLTQATDDHGNLASSATRVSLPISLTGSLEAGGDVDFFEFSANARETYVLEIDAGVTARLYDVDGTTELVRSNSTGSLTWTAPTPGPYFVSFRGVEGDYAFTVAALTDDFGNDSTAASLIAPLPRTVAGAIDFWGDTDFFSFVATAGTVYVVESASNAGPGESALRLYDVDGVTELASHDSSITWGPPLTWMAPSTGVYFIEFTHLTDEIGPYSLEVSVPIDDHENDAANASVMLASSLSASIDYSGDSDFFSFFATAGRVYRVVDSETLTDITLYDSNGTVPLASADFNSSIRWLAPVSGWYYVEVHGTLFGPPGTIGPVPYSLSVTAEGPIVPLFADANQDGFVDSRDLGRLLNNFGDSGFGWKGGNFNDDEVVDSTDLGLLLNSFGKGRAAATVEHVDSHFREPPEEDSEDALDLIFGSVFAQESLNSRKSWHGKRLSRR